MTDPQSILATVRTRLEQNRGRLPTVAQESGVPYWTLVKIAQGVVRNPRVKTVQALIDYFNRAA